LNQIFAINKYHYSLMESDKCHEEFLKWLNPKQLSAYNFAKKQLNDTFDLEKSNLYLEWLKTLEKKS